MKKQLLFVAALFASIAASAQTVVWPCTSTSEDGKNATSVNNDATVTGSETIEAYAIGWGTGILDPSTCQKTHKNVAGESLNYFEDGTTCVTKWVPVVPSDAAIKTLAEADGAGQTLEFTVYESDPEKYLDIKKITFNAARYGTDAVRINVKLKIESNEAGESETEWLFTDDTWNAYSGGEGFWTAGEIAEGNTIPGYGPAREDASKDNTNDKNEDGFSNIVIPTTDLIPADAYKVTLHLTVYGIGNNKAMGLNNVTFSSEAATGVNGIQAEKAVVEGQTYDLGGRPATKGLLIQKGKAKRFVK
ncbi:MAG: hypothetical protein ACI3Y0_13355 [Prevotella sp.]